MKKRRVICIITAIMMALSIMSTVVFAEDEGQEQGAEQPTVIEPDPNPDPIPTPVPTPKPKKAKKRIKIMLDAGHAGSYNRGSVKGYYESKMNWRLTNYLKDELKKYGFVVGMTKKSLRHNPSVYGRGLKARGYHLFLSIHSNWSSSRRTDYPLAIVSSKYKKKLYKKAQPLGKRLAVCVGKTMRTKQRAQVWIKRQRGGQDWYGVIRGAAKRNVPAIILEHSFHSNKSKCRWLMKKKNLKIMAKREAAVIAKYYGMKKLY